MRMNTQSIREFDPARMKKGTVVDQRPHYITRRYAEFAAGILSVTSASVSNADEEGASSSSAVATMSSTSEEMMSALLSDMQQEVEQFILKMTSAVQQQQGGGRKAQLIFLINNYDVVLSVLAERSGGDSKEADSFKDLMQTRTVEYVDLVLFPHFGSLIKFIQRAELLIGSGDERGLSQEAEAISALIVNFNRGWKVRLLFCLPWFLPLLLLCCCSCFCCLYCSALSSRCF